MVAAHALLGKRVQVGSVSVFLIVLTQPAEARMVAAVPANLGLAPAGKHVRRGNA